MKISFLPAAMAILLSISSFAGDISGRLQINSTLTDDQYDFQLRLIQHDGKNIRAISVQNYNRLSGTIVIAFKDIPDGEYTLQLLPLIQGGSAHPLAMQFLGNTAELSKAQVISIRGKEIQLVNWALNIAKHGKGKSNLTGSLSHIIGAADCALYGVTVSLCEKTGTHLGSHSSDPFFQFKDLDPGQYTVAFQYQDVYQSFDIEVPEFVSQKEDWFVRFHNNQFIKVNQVITAVDEFNKRKTFFIFDKQSQKIRIQGSEPGDHIAVYSLSGRELLNIQAQENDEFYVNHWATGYYFCRLIRNNKSFAGFNFIK